MSFEPILLAPEEEIREIYPYRRVWRTSWAEALILAVTVAGIWAATSLFDLLPVTRASLPRLAMALVPLAAWLLISYRAERRAPQPRQRILAVLVLGALVANAIAVPLERRLFEPELWLPEAGFFGRVWGYGFTSGMATALLLYLMLRYSVWPGHFTQRQDGAAYALAAALGYASVYNLHSVLDTDATLVATALRVASITYSHLAVGALVGFFMAELVVGRVPIIWLPFGLSFAALVAGLYHAFRAVAIVGGLSTAGTGSNPIRGFALAFGLVAAMYVAIAFIIESADTRQQHATRRPEISRELL